MPAATCISLINNSPIDSTWHTQPLVACRRPRPFRLGVPGEIRKTLARRLRRLHCRWIQQLESKRRAETMDLLHVEFAHELNRFRTDNLPWNHDWESRGIRNYKVRRDQFRALFQTLVNLRAE